MILILTLSVYLGTAYTAFSVEIPGSTHTAGSIKSIKNGLWTEPTTWDPQRIPSAGDIVLVSKDTVVTYDAHSAQEIGEVMIEGKLTFSTNKSTQLVVGNVMVHASGTLEIGSKENPIPRPHTAALKFVVTKPGEQGLMMTGRGDIHGAPIKNTFTKLTRDANEDSTKLFVKDDVQDWDAGSRIVITTSGQGSCTELNSVVSANDKVITLKHELECFHDGTEPTQADVAILTRNVSITSILSGSESEDVSEPHSGAHADQIFDPELSPARQPFLELNHERRGLEPGEDIGPARRGHTMFMQCGHEGDNSCTNAGGSISYAEFFNLGPEGKLGRYPIHFHEMGDSGKGMYIQGNSIWNSANRWITIHGTNGLTIRDNVGFGSIGHGYFLEDGNEVNNIIDHNIGISTEGGDLIDSDETPAVFWMENPANTWTSNIAVEGGYYGFHFDVPDRVQRVDGLKRQVNLGSLAILRFENNEAHNNGVYGLRTSAGGVNHEEDSDSHTIIPSGNIDNFLSWRNRYWGIRLEGSGTEVTNSLFIGNVNGGNIGFGGAGDTVRNSEAMGEVNDGWRAGQGVIFDGGDDNVLEHSTIKGHGEAGIVFHGGRNNIVRDSVLDQRVFLERNGSTIELHLLTADVRVSHGHGSASIINTKMLNPRTIVFGLDPIDTHLIIQNYNAPNDNHKNLPNDFTLWNIDTVVQGGVLDPYFVAVIGPIDFEIAETETGKKVLDKSQFSSSLQSHSDATSTTTQTTFATDRLSVSNADFVNAQGSSVSSAQVGQQVVVKAEIRNEQNNNQDSVYIVQIKNSKGVVISISWISGSVGAGQSLTSTQSWIPEVSGKYIAQIFVWQSIAKPFPLTSSITELDINVA
jgi:hypothetical protein